jgi:signal transduction histidine kinase
VAHEFRNPLATALWCTQLLGRLGPEERGGPRGQKLASMAQRAVARVGRLLEDHFLVERLEANGLPLRPEPVELCAAVRAAAEAAGVAVATTGGELTVPADRGLLQRCLEAVVAAAGKEGAQVRVEIEAAASGASVRVLGAPLPPEALERPVKGAPSDPTGRALGLLAARAAAGAMGATLDVAGGAAVLSLPGEGRAEP